MLAPWWRRLPGRLLAEQDALNMLRCEDPPVTRAHRWVRGPDGEPRVHVDLALGSDTMKLEIRFPEHYPEGCPSVRPVPYDLHISGHQYTRSGILCLEIGPDNWHPYYTCADMVRSARRLVLHERVATTEPHAIPSRDVVRLADRIRKADGVLLRTSALEARLKLLPDQADLEFVWSMRNGERIMPTALPKGQELPGLPPAFSREIRFAGCFRRLRAGTPRTVPTDRNEFIEFVTEFGTHPLADGMFLVLLQWEDGATSGFLLRSSKSVPLADMAFVSDDRTRMPAHVAPLDEARVAIVGLGSLGSKVAVSLARTGVRRFILVDDDVFCSENVCRHEGDISDVGAPKVDVVAELLRDVSFVDPEIERWHVAVARATNPELHAKLLETLATADLIVDATANPDAFGLLAMIASDRGLPMVWGEVFAGGIGGLVAGASPRSGPCPRCVRIGFQLAARDWPTAPYQAAGERYETEDDGIVASTDAAVAYVAAAMTTRVEAALASPSPFAPAVTILGIRVAWIFDIPFQSRAVNVRSDDVSCSRCWVAPSEPDESTALRADALFTGDVDADDPPAA